MTKCETSVASGRHFLMGMTAETTPLTSQLPLFACLEKPSKLSPTSGNGLERPNILSYRFQITVCIPVCGHHKEGVSKRIGGGVTGGKQGFLTGQYEAV